MATIEKMARVLIEEARRPRAIDTSRGTLKLVLAIYRQGMRDGRRAVARKGGHARSKSSFEQKIARLRIYAAVLSRNKLAWRHPQTMEHLRLLQIELTKKNVKARSLATIRKDLAEMKNFDAASKQRPTRFRRTPS